MPSVAPRVGTFRVHIKRGLSGFGLFAVDAIPKGKFIIEYWGEKVTDAEADRRGGKYLFTLDNGYTIDGKSRKNLARYINHACKPNAEPVVHGHSVYISSKKAIKPGEEITYNYGKEYWGEYIKPFGCRCGTCKQK